METGMEVNEATRFSTTVSSTSGFASTSLSSFWSRTLRVSFSAVVGMTTCRVTIDTFFLTTIPPSTES